VIVAGARPSALSAARLLEIWERGAAWHPLDQALLVVQTADSDGPAEDPSEWTIGRRDRRLLEIRRDTFADRIDGCAECPACRSSLEFELSCASLIELQLSETRPERTVEHDGMPWLMRAPNSRDLAVIALEPDLHSARTALLARCARPVNEDGPRTGAWTESQQVALGEALADLDPLAEILIDLTCQACGHTWQCLFDIATFLWSEIRARSRRLLQDIDVLARTYGWTESEILRLSDRRRGLYVQMALS
jgi:hypothetical protein